MAGLQCCIPAPPCDHISEGKEQLVASLLSYVVSSTSPKAAVILATDIYGFEAPVLRKLADKIATFGYHVVVPDFLNKDYFCITDPDEIFSHLGSWMEKHNPVDVFDDATKVIEAVIAKGFQSVGIVGFCWGAKLAIHFAQGDLVKAVVLCHPAFLTVDDIQEVRIPLAILAAEIDEVTPPAVVQEFANILTSKPEVESFVHVYPGAEHSWTCRYDVNDENAVKKAEEAHKKMLEWLEKYCF